MGFCIQGHARKTNLFGGQMTRLCRMFLTASAALTVLWSLAAIPLFAQPGPALFQWTAGIEFIEGGGGAHGSGGGQNCVSTVSNPYVNPKFTTVGPYTNCALGSSLSTSTPVQGSTPFPDLLPLSSYTDLQVSGSGLSVSKAFIGDITATTTISAFSTNDPTEWEATSGATSAYYQENLPAGVGPGNPLSLTYQIQGSTTGGFGCVEVDFYLVSDDPSQEVFYSPDLGVQCFAQTNPAVNQSVTTPPLTIGPSGTYSIYIFLNVMQSSLGTSTLHVGCPVNVTVLPKDPSEEYMQATLTAPGLANLHDYATSCGFAYFDWQQVIQALPAPSPFFPQDPSMIPTANKQVNGSLTAPPPFLDPPPGGYASYPADNPAPFYYALSELAPGGTCTVYNDAGTGCESGFPYIWSSDGSTLSFADNPTDHCLYGGDAAGCGGMPVAPQGMVFAFTTSLVGVDSMNNATILYNWNWYSTFNGSAGGGGVSQAAHLYPVNPGSGTGGVTLTAVNGAQLPPVVPSSQISITASGLAFSRITSTFNGTLTVQNISASAISAPLLILFTGLPNGVTLANETSDLSGMPYLTVSSPASLAPGQSVVVSLRFENPANAKISLTTTVYSGSIN